MKIKTNCCYAATRLYQP